ncbi:putative quorum-sensing-regulated virulence factor [Myxococcota bacterium]
MRSMLVCMGEYGLPSGEALLELQTMKMPFGKYRGRRRIVARCS